MPVLEVWMLREKWDVRSHPLKEGYYLLISIYIWKLSTLLKEVTVRWEGAQTQTNIVQKHVDHKIPPKVRKLLGKREVKEARQFQNSLLKWQFCIGKHMDTKEKPRTSSKWWQTYGLRRRVYAASTNNIKEADQATQQVALLDSVHPARSRDARWYANVTEVSPVFTPGNQRNNKAPSLSVKRLL